MRAPTPAQATNSIADDLEQELADATLPPKNKGKAAKPPPPEIGDEEVAPEITNKGAPGAKSKRGLVIGGVGGLVLLTVAGVGAMKILQPTGTLLVQVSPSAGASVLVDGTPNPQPGNFAFANLKAGTHQMVVTGPGSDAVSQTVTIEKDQTAIIKVSLKKEGGDPVAVTIVETVAGAEISIDGNVVRPKGDKTLYSGQVDSSKGHKLTLKADGYKVVTKEFDAGKPIVFQEPLEADKPAEKAAPDDAPKDDKPAAAPKPKKAAAAPKGDADSP
jgi:hypothetical protein